MNSTTIVLFIAVAIAAIVMAVIVVKGEKRYRIWPGQPISKWK